MSTRTGYLLAAAWLLAVTLAALLAPLLRITPGLIPGTLMTFVDLSAVAVVAAIGGGLGVLLLPNELLADFTPEERAVFQALAGLGLISIVVLALGLIGAFPPRWLAWLAVVVVMALLNGPVRRWLSDLVDGLRAVFAPADDSVLRWIRWGVLLMLLAAGLVALAPPTQWDALMYHLAGGQTYLGAGRIIPTPDNYRLSFPQLTTMLYTLMQLLARPQAAQLLHGSFGVLSLLTLHGVSRRVGRPAVAWVAAVVLLASSTMLQLFAAAYADVTAMAYGFAAVMLLLNPDDDSRIFALVGFFAGCLMGTRYTSFIAVIGIGVLTLWSARRMGVIRPVAITVGVALLTFSPWLLKNTLLDVNPVAPFVWGAPAYDDLDAQYEDARYARRLGPLEAALLPLQASVFGAEGQDPYQANINPLMLALLPLPFLGWKRRSDADRALYTSLLIFSGASYVVWLISGLVTTGLLILRFVFPVMPALALLVAHAALTLPPLRGGIDLQRLTMIVIGVVLALGVIRAVVFFSEASPMAVALGLETEAAYLSREMPTYYPAMQAVNDLPEQARVMMLWEPRGFYCHPRCIPDDTINRWWHALQTHPNADKVIDVWTADGISYVLVYNVGGRFLLDDAPDEHLLTEADWTALEAMRRTRFTEVWGNEVYTLYTIDP